MSVIGKNFNHCRRCMPISPKRRIASGSSNTTEISKIQAKRIVLNQWKLIDGLKTYFSKFTTGRLFENALNKEFAVFLQKIDDKTYGNGLLYYFSKTENKSSEKTTADSETELKEETKIVKVPKWKKTKLTLNNKAISQRTNYIVKTLATSKDIDHTLSATEDLILHLKSYHVAKHNAVKMGAIRHLLALRANTENGQVKGALSEALALLGYTDPVSGKGIKILSIDGGGTRGILVIEMLKKLEELTQKPLYETFDFICGVSTGAIIATLLGLAHKTLDEIDTIYREISTEIFTQSKLKGASSLVFNHSYYDTALWEKLLKQQWDENTTLIQTRRDSKTPKFCALSAVVNQASLSAFVFRNYTLPCRIQSTYMGGYNYKLWECVRASAAAPTYFEEFKLGHMIHQDGGILINNPAAVAIHEAKLLWPNTPLQCLISFGTGKTTPFQIDPLNADGANSNTPSWKDKFLAIVNSATDTEDVHRTLSDLLPHNVYYRLNPYITEMYDMDEIEPDKIEQLRRDALMYLRRNEDKFQAAANKLNESKTSTQRLAEWVQFQMNLHRLSSHC